MGLNKVIVLSVVGLGIELGTFKSISAKFLYLKAHLYSNVIERKTD